MSHSISRVMAAAAVVITFMNSGVASAQLFSQSQLVTTPGGGFGGADVSAMQSPLNFFGFGDNPATARLADDFTVSGGIWNVSGFRFFAYQGGSTTTSTFNVAQWQLWNGRPGDGGSVVIAGNIATNTFSGTGFTGIYRAAASTPTANDRPIMYVDATASIALSAGTYWLDWSLNGSLGSGPFVPPVTLLGVTTGTGNGRQFLTSTGTWNDAIDTGNSTVQGLPFQVRGTINSVVPEPSTYVLLASALLGLAAVSRRRKRA